MAGCLRYFTEMCSGSEAGSYLRLIDFEYHSTLGLRARKDKKVLVCDPEIGEAPAKVALFMFEREPRQMAGRPAALLSRGRVVS